MIDNQPSTRNTRSIIGPSVEIVRDTDDILNVDTTLGAVSLTLQNIRTSGLMLTPRCVYINDTGGQSSVNPITILGAGGDLVNNAASLVIASNGANATCQISNQTEWAVSGTGISTAGITGIGAVNRIAKFTAPDIIGNSQIFDNGVSVGINTITPNALALLDLESITKGLLVPRMTTAQRNAIVAPPTSLLLFNLTTNYYEYYSGTTWLQVMDRSELENLMVYNANFSYSSFENFDKGVIPQGWAQTSSGAPATVNYVQPYESGAIGRVVLNAPGPAALFASLTYSNGYNYLLNFSDCIFTKWNCRFKRDPANVGVMLVGMANQPGTAVPSVFANVIALVHDPNNMTGANPGLLTTFFVWIKDSSGQSIYNTGVSPNNTYQQVNFEYNYSNPLAPYVAVTINNVLVATVPGSDANLFVSQAAGANAGLKPVLYTGKTVAASGGNQLIVDSFNIIRRWI